MRSEDFSESVNRRQITTIPKVTSYCLGDLFVSHSIYDTNFVLSFVLVVTFPLCSRTFV